MPELMDKTSTSDAPPATEADAIRFDVAHEPWLPVVRADGTLHEVGLIEALRKAHEFHALHDPMPPVECGLMRLLVAFALDIFKPQDALDWAETWDKGRFDEAQVREYFAQHADRFDLFDAAHPFLQDPTLEGDDKPLAGLLPSQPAGTNAAHFHHGAEAAFAVAPAVAARLLATIAPFMTAGGAGLSPSINGAPPWYVLLEGANLFQTIWLNCPVIADILLPPIEDDAPAWRDARPLAKSDRSEAGLLEALTWRPRRIRLMPHFATPTNRYCALSGRETPILVGRMKFAAAWSTRFEWRDPNVPYRFAEKGATVLRPREGRAVWRDVGALALLRHSDKAQRPGIVTQFDDLLRSRNLAADTPLRLTIYGMRTDMKMKVFEWHREPLQVPVALLWQENLLNTTEAEMKLAEDVAYILGRAIKHTYPRDGAGNDKAFDTLIARAQMTFWQRLRPHYLGPAGSLLHDLAPLNPENARAQFLQVLATWHQALSRVARVTLNEAIGELDTDGEAMKRLVEARHQFEGRLWALLNPAAAVAAREKKKKEQA